MDSINGVSMNGSLRREFAIPSDTAAGKLAVEEMLDGLRTKQWEEDDIFGVHLSIEEALVNAIKHGNKLDPAKEVRIRYEINERLARFEFADEGSGFNPGDVPDPTDDDNLEIPSGRGIMLMRSFMTRVDYSPQGNAVVMEKVRKASA